MPIPYTKAEEVGSVCEQCSVWQGRKVYIYGDQVVMHAITVHPSRVAAMLNRVFGDHPHAKYVAEHTFYDRCKETSSKETK